MSYVSAMLFAWLQGADFYRRLHRQAVETVPAAPGHWLDVGCGPGLIAGMAAERGYRAVGVDRDPQMIRLARKIGRRTGSSARFETRDLSALQHTGQRFDVVSAASLLAVVDDPQRTLDTLLACTRPQGTLLIVEPTAAMTRRAARDLASSGRLGRRAAALRLWAYARQGRAVSPELFHRSGHLVTETVLLNGMVAAWTITTPAAGQ